MGHICQKYQLRLYMRVIDYHVIILGLCLVIAESLHKLKLPIQSYFVGRMAIVMGVNIVFIMNSGNGNGAP